MDIHNGIPQAILSLLSLAQWLAQEQEGGEGLC